MDSTLITVKEAAGYLRLNYMTVYKLAQRGKIPALKVGGNWRFKKDLLDKWLSDSSTVAQGLVLVVDDDPRVRDTLEEIIVKSGHRAVAVGDGESALAELRKRCFDLVFLDLVLPGLSGVGILRQVKAIDQRAVVAVVTGYGDDPIALEAMSLGPLLLIRKPFKISDITQVLF